LLNAYQDSLNMDKLEVLAGLVERYPF